MKISLIILFLFVVIVLALQSVFINELSFVKEGLETDYRDKVTQVLTNKNLSNESKLREILKINSQPPKTTPPTPPVTTAQNPNTPPATTTTTNTPTPTPTPSPAPATNPPAQSVTVIPNTKTIIKPMQPKITTTTTKIDPNTITSLTTTKLS